VRKELNVWWGFLSDKNPWNEICGPPIEHPIMATVFTSDAAGLTQACLYKGDKGVASVGYTVKVLSSTYCLFSKSTCPT
jgi:hypothetical protein